jgi:hypothetical protein
MAGGQPLDWDGYRFTVKPLSQGRRIVRDFWPYWQSSRPKFVLTIARLTSPAQEQTINWFIRFATGDVTGGQVIIPPLKTGETIDFIVGGKLLGFTGDTLVALPANLTSLKLDPYNTLYSFHTTPKSWLALAFVAAFLAGIFAALGHWLLGLIN